MSGQSGQVEKKKNPLEDVDVGQVAISLAKNFVTNRPVTSGLWVLGLLLAAFANGFNVDATAADSYKLQLEQADEVGGKELQAAIRNYRQADEVYYNAKGWFWQCDQRCQKAKDKMEMAQNNMNRVKAKVDQIISDGRAEVGIWSIYGVRDVRKAFWDAWESGKAMAARWTMMDAMFMAFTSSREESFMATIMKLIFQYVVNLTIGLIMGVFYFFYAVYSLIQSYGETMMSGTLFFFLCFIAGCATVGTYLIAIYGTVAGGTVYLAKQAMANAALEGDGRRRQQQRVGYQGQQYGQRPHFN